MGFFFAAFKLHIKRLCKRPAIAVCLLLIPVLTLGLGLSLSKSEQAALFKIGVYLPETQELSEPIWESLTTYIDDQLRIERIDDADTLTSLVADTALDIGYIFPDDLDERVAEGRYTRMIIRVASPSSPETVMGWPITYVMSAALLEVCAPDIAAEYLAEKGIVPEEEQYKLQPIMEEFFDSDKLMAVTVETAAGDAAETDAGVLTGASLIRGLMALVLLLFAYLCAIQFSDDLTAGFFMRIKPFTHTASLFFPAYLAAMALMLAAGIMSILLAGIYFPASFGPFFRELGWMAAYLIYLAAFSFALSAIFTGKQMIAAMPFVLILALLFCPIVMDIGHFIPAGQAVSLLLPPTLYLRAVAGNVAAYWQLPVAAAIWAVIGFSTALLRLRRRKMV